MAFLGAPGPDATPGEPIFLDPEDVFTRFALATREVASALRAFLEDELDANICDSHLAEFAQALAMTAMKTVGIVHFGMNPAEVQRVSEALRDGVAEVAQQD